MSSRYKDALGLIVMENFKDFGNKIDKKIREERKLNTSFIITSKLEKFDDGTKKVVVDEDLIRENNSYTQMILIIIFIMVFMEIFFSLFIVTIYNIFIFLVF